MRVFSELIFDDVIRGTGEVYSSPGFNELLGKADEVVYELYVSVSSGTSPTVTLRHLHSCSNQGTFTGLSSLINGASISSVPYQNVVQQTGPLGGYGKAGITLGGTNPTARIRIWATGRGTCRS